VTLIGLDALKAVDPLLGLLCSSAPIASLGALRSNLLSFAPLLRSCIMSLPAPLTRFNGFGSFLLDLGILVEVLV